MSINIINMTEEQLLLLESCSKDKTDFSFNGYECIAKCVDVYDGDTCKLKFFYCNMLFQYSCRMNGYDCWELKPKKNNRSKESIDKEKDLAAKAKQKLQSLILNKIIYVKFGQFDKYGRPLISIFLNKTDTESVNDLMIKEKYGKPYKGGSKENFDSIA
ncbi:SNase-like protein [Catovirus CTV1]|uniref:SNase-like protein n=1 Tax=Catovirus CTV1 TaxID=1977631 RepID=A0A1V0S9B8_9VIRU|nr:SNase-like protein [Catovirus CTV1]